MNLNDLLNNPDLLQSVLDDPMQLLSPSEREALRLCALVHAFDKVLFDDVLKSPASADFMQLEANRYVERIPGRRQFKLGASVRQQLLDEWRQDAERLAVISEKLVDYYEAIDEPLEAAYHRIVADPVAAWHELQARMVQASAQYDLNQLYALQSMLHERKPLLTFELNQLRRDVRARYEARALWATAYYETRVYQERSQTEPLLTELRRGDENWVMQLFAPGGMGKTMYLRAAVANHCVPNNWPVAKIDFDYVHHMNEVVDQPWRLLLTIADQLNRQLPGRPFHSLLRSNQNYVAQADPDNALFEPVLTPVDAGQMAVMQAEIVEHFSSLIPHGQPYLLIFDTLEQLRHRQITLTALFNLLVELRKRSPDLRVMLSGRFDLASPLPGQPAPSPFTHYFGQAAVSVKLEAFSPTEAHDYLTEQRNLPDDEVLLTAMIAKSERNPFKLALLAEIVENDPAIGADKIQAYESADFAYLIERIVTRINEPWVRWVLRYGVVPRQLDEQFVDQIIVPTVLELKQGLHNDDDPELDQVAEYTDRPEDPFSIATLTDAPPADLWDKLTEYASGYSWVRPAETEAALRFHADVVTPVRLLLLRHHAEGRKIYQRLQEASFHYYAALAQERGQPRHLREAVYHNYLAQRGDAYWLEQYNAVMENDQLVKALANEAIDLAAAQNVEEDAAGEVVGARVLALAAYERAYRDLPPDRRLAIDATLAVETSLVQAQQADGNQHIGADRLAVLHGCLLLAHNRQDDLLALTASIEPTTDRTRLDLYLLQAHVLRDRGQLNELGALVEEAEPVVAALAASPSARDHRFAKTGERTLVAALARLASERERLPEADGYYARLLDMVEKNIEKNVAENIDAGEIAEIARFAAQRVVLLGRMGQEQRARRIGEASLDRLRNAPPGDERELALTRLEAEICLVRQRPDLARERLDAIDQPPETDPAWLDLNARVYAASLEVSQAIDAWARAVTVAGRDAAVISQQADIGCAWLYLEVLDDVVEAEALLNSLADAPRVPLTGFLLRARLLQRQGKTDSAWGLLRKALDDAQPAGKIHIQVHRLATREAAKIDWLNVWLNDVGTQLCQVEPFRRLSLFDDLVHYKSLDLPKDWPSQSFVDRLSENLPPIDPHVQDAALAWLWMAEIHRVFGASARARKLLNDIADQRISVLIRLYRAYDRIGWLPTRLKNVHTTIIRDLEQTIITDTDSLDKLHLLMLLEQVERLYRYGEVCAIRDLADRIKAPVATSTDFLHSLADTFRDRLGAAWQLRITRMQETKIDAPAALAYQQNALEISRQRDDQRGEYITLYNIGLTYVALDQPTSARDHLRQALTLGQKMGDAKAVATLNAEIEDITLPAEDLAFSGFDDADESTPKALGVADPPISTPVRSTETMIVLENDLRRIDIDGTESVEVIGVTNSYDGILDLDAKEAVPPWQFARLFTNEYKGVSRNLGGLLVDSERLRTAGTPTHLRVELPTDLCYMPWELAAIDERPVVMSEQYLSFCRGYELRRSLESPRAGIDVDVLLLRLGLMLEGLVFRGTSESGMEIADYFEDAGLTLETLEQPDPQRLYDYLTKYRPSVLCLEVNVIESRGVLSLDFGSGGYGKVRGNEFTARTLASMLGEIRGAPLVILETPGAPDVADNVRQLCLRNAFSHELMQHTHISSVVASGLADPYRLRQAPISLLAQGLAQRLPIRDIVKKLWQTSARAIDWNTDGEELLAHLLPSAGVALFTREPTRILEVGR